MFVLLVPRQRNALAAAACVVFPDSLAAILHWKYPNCREAWVHGGSKNSRVLTTKPGAQQSHVGVRSMEVRGAQLLHSLKD